MSERRCQWCNGLMQLVPSTSPTRVVTAVFCRICDRRQCSTCKKFEQDVSAVNCTSCGVKY